SLDSPSYTPIFITLSLPRPRGSTLFPYTTLFRSGVKVERENQTLATITFQNYFRMYKKLAGMTGTAETEAPEFDKIYKLEVMVIDRKSTRLNSSHQIISYAVFCLIKKKEG